MNLEVRLLKVLADTEETTVTAKYLFAQANQDAGDDASSISEIRAALWSLEAKRQVVAVKDKDRGTAQDPYVYQITSTGKARALK